MAGYVVTRYTKSFASLLWHEVEDLPRKMQLRPDSIFEDRTSFDDLLCDVQRSIVRYGCLLLRSIKHEPCLRASDATRQRWCLQAREEAAKHITYIIRVLRRQSEPMDQVRYMLMLVRDQLKRSNRVASRKAA
ncbi:MAG: hypothetical protein WEC84_00175 [Candidatus Andersenbacteria bacterium]